MLNLAAVILILVTLQRLSELVIAQRNTARLIAAGGVETGAGHYPVMVALHSSWLLGLWYFAWNAQVNVPLLVVYGVLQLGRLWVLATLGSRWTTRIISVPGEQPVTTGPYAFMRHPNYVVVAAEVPLLPLVFGLTWFAMLFCALNFAMLAWRIRAENLAWRGV
jgi:methyltransferase